MKIRIYLQSLFLIYLQSAIASVQAGATSFVPPSHFEPQVAIYCGGKQRLHNQYLDETGRWVSDLDPDATCTTDKVRILEYCKKVYPKRDITNIVESNHMFKIDNWCRYGQKKCKQAQWIKPYRCLEGLFQSDALLVPEHCLFDHIHNQSKCLGFDSWNQTAAHSCSRREMALRSFAMLLPCGIDVFSGVEFVCCPYDKNTWRDSEGKKNTLPSLSANLARLEQVDSMDLSPGSSTFPPSSSSSSSESSSSESDSRESSELNNEEAVTEASFTTTTQDYYYGHFDSNHEHDEFKAAERRLIERHREEVKKLMKEWSTMEQHYEGMVSDPRRIDVYKQNLTIKYQKMIAGLEAKGTAEKKQLLALHLQRVMHAISEKKREALDCYTRALAAEIPKTQKIQKCLEKLIRALEKDRAHVIGHFKHLLNSNVKQATNEKAATISRLAEIDHALNTSLIMLDRQPEVAAKIKHSILKFVQRVRTNNHAVLPVELQNIEEGSEHWVNKDVQETAQIERKKPEPVSLSKKTESVEVGVSKEVDTKDGGVVFYPGINKDEGLPSMLLPQPKMVHAHWDVPQHEQSYKLSNSIPYHRRRNTTASIITLGFFCFALLAAILVGVAMLRRRTNNQSEVNDVNQAATPEERHVTSMQVNGYENPTYKYFETK